MKYTIETTPNFERRYKKLKKRFPKIDDDFETLIDEIEVEGNIGDDVPGMTKDGNKVFKKRMENTSSKKK